jgi:octaprenyl-diphosphate synthase
MASEQTIVSQLSQTAERGVRPERAQAALAEVPTLPETLAELERQLTEATGDAEARLQAAARHLVSAGGKRIRPMVSLLACGANGGDMKAAIPYAVAAELTHSATLLHDDVIDDGPMRRGQPASRVLWGNSVSVLSGDWLLTRALEIVARAPAARQALLPLLATMRRLVEGEVLQLTFRGTFAATEATYLQVVVGKTASLFGWAAAAGGWAAGAHGAIPEALSVFGEGIGIAFQLVDDALDYAADPGLLGKQLGTDLIEGKATLPLLRALEAQPALRGRLSLLMEGKADGVAVAGEVLEAVQRSGGVEAARALARQHTARAMAALDRLPDGLHRRALAEAARSLTERAF